MSERKISRREFLRVGAAGTAALALGGTALARSVQPVLPAPGAPAVISDGFPGIGADLISECPVLVALQSGLQGRQMPFKVLHVAQDRVYRLRTRLPYIDFGVLGIRTGMVNDRPLLGWPAGSVMLTGVNTTKNFYDDGSVDCYVETYWCCRSPIGHGQILHLDGTWKPVCDAAGRPLRTPTNLHLALEDLGVLDRVVCS